MTTKSAKLKATAVVGMLAGMTLEVLNLKMESLVPKMAEATAMAAGGLPKLTRVAAAFEVGYA